MALPNSLFYVVQSITLYDLKRLPPLCSAALLFILANKLGKLLAIPKFHGRVWSARSCSLHISGLKVEGGNIG